MYIRTTDEALDALAETLRHPERRSQLIDLTVKVILCLHPEPRQLLADCHAVLVSGSLDDLARRRQELLEAARMEDIVLVVDPEEDRLYDVVGRAQDALRLGAVAARVFPALADRHPPWEFARAARTAETALRDALTEAVRVRGTPDAAPEHDRLLRRVEAWILQGRPGWHDRVDALRAACEQLCGPGDEAASLAQTVAAADDEYVIHILSQIERSPSDALASLTTARDVARTLQRLAEDETGAADDSRRRVA